MDKINMFMLFPACSLLHLYRLGEHERSVVPNTALPVAFPAALARQRSPVGRHRTALEGATGKWL